MKLNSVDELRRKIKDVNDGGKRWLIRGERDAYRGDRERGR